jgi:hypothetical protein
MAAWAWLRLIPAAEVEHAHLGYGDLTVLPRYLIGAIATLAFWGAYIAGVGL